MRTIKQYHVPAKSEGVIEIPMPEYATVLGISRHGRGIVVMSDDHNNLVPKKFIVVLEDEPAHLALGHRYLGDLQRETAISELFTQYVFEWMHPKAP